MLFIFQATPCPKEANKDMINDGASWTIISTGTEIMMMLTLMTMMVMMMLMMVMKVIMIFQVLN